MQLSFHKADAREHVADFGTRVLAFCLDSLLLLLIIGVIEYYTVSSNEQAWLFKSERLLHFLMGWLYFAGTESSAWQASLGKQLLGLRVVDLEGKRITFRCATIRYVLKPVSVFVFLMRFISSSVHTNTLLFHDKVAKTRVLMD